MSQYLIAHTCGHSETVQLYGPGSDRDRRAAWMREQPCLSCKRATETQTAAQDATSRHLPGLVGSDKQVAWALKIRAAQIRYAEQKLADQRHKSQDARARKLITLFEDILTSECQFRVDAKWWIDNRFDSDLYDMIAARIRDSRAAVEDIIEEN